MRPTTFQLRFYGHFCHAGIDICRNFNVLTPFQLTSSLLRTYFQLPVFQLGMPIGLATWKVARTFHLARPLYRPRWHLFGLVRAGAAVRSQPAPAPLGDIGPTP
jgi:hypothetical protein